MPKKIIASFIIFTSLFFLINKSTYADIINPEIFTKNCPPNKLKVNCVVRRSEIGGPYVVNECEKYENNSNYTPLASSESTFGGSRTYCRSTPIAYLNYFLTRFLIPLSVTILIEFLIIYVLTNISKEDKKYIVYANVITFTALQVLILIINEMMPDAKDLSFILLVIFELFIVLFEGLYYKNHFKDISLYKCLFVSLFANLASAIGGTIILFLLKIFFMSTKDLFKVFIYQNLIPETV